MKVYAENGARVAGQLFGDLLTVAWIAAWVGIGLFVNDLVGGFAAPGRKVETAGNDVAAAANQAAQNASSVPVVGDLLAQPMRTISNAARQVSEAGVAQQDAVRDAGLLLGIVIAVGPILFALLLWTVTRWRWMREATAAANLRDGDADPRLLALRALVSLPLRKLARVGGANPYAALDGGDPKPLARTALRELGLEEYPISRE
ncbi:MAG: hypothetical protein ACR2MA_04335 [Egibacteraceae bacterium]